MKRTNINFMEENNSTAVKSGITAKVIAAAAAAVLVIGIPAGLGLSKVVKGEQTAPAALAAEVPAAKSENTVPSASASVSASTDETALGLPKAAVKKAAETKTETKTKTKAKAKKKTKKAKKTSEKKAETAKNEVKLPETVIPTKNSAPAAPKKTEPAPAAPKKVVPAPVETPQLVNADPDMSVDKMRSMTTSELIALSDYEYEIVNSANTQISEFGIRCKAFPDYVFIPEQYNEFSDLYQGTPDRIHVPVHYPDGTQFNIEFGEYISKIDLYGDAYIGGGISVGMRYNEIEELLGQDIAVRKTGTSLELGAPVYIDGEYWTLHFSLTEEQKNELMELISESELNGVHKDGIVPIYGGSIDISNIDPVCDIAVSSFFD